MRRPSQNLSRGNAGARYEALFTSLDKKSEGAFVPFFVLGYPDLATSKDLLSAAVQAGADALEVGIPFSDPIADGPVLAQASRVALSKGANPGACFDICAELRQQHPSVPLGLLTYANLVVGPGLDAFYARAASAGMDSILIADVPLFEAGPFVSAARASGIAQVLLAPPNLPSSRIPTLAKLATGYTYVVARKGVTGAEAQGDPAQKRLYTQLEAASAPPPLLGFGISSPEHVRGAIEMGAKGAISGSAVALQIEACGSSRAQAIARVTSFVRTMKAATRR